MINWFELQVLFLFLLHFMFAAMISWTSSGGLCRHVEHLFVVCERSSMSQRQTTHVINEDIREKMNHCCHSQTGKNLAQSSNFSHSHVHQVFFVMLKYWFLLPYSTTTITTNTTDTSATTPLPPLYCSGPLCSSLLYC